MPTWLHGNLVTLKKNHYSRSNAASLAAKLQNSSDFWKEFRTCCGERKPELINSIDTQGWLDHFKQVFFQADDRVDGRGGGGSEFSDDATEFSDFDSGVLKRPIQSLKPEIEMPKAS